MQKMYRCARKITTITARIRHCRRRFTAYFALSKWKLPPSMDGLCANTHHC